MLQFGCSEDTWLRSLDGVRCDGLGTCPCLVLLLGHMKRRALAVRAIRMSFVCFLTDQADGTINKAFRATGPAA